MVKMKFHKSHRFSATKFTLITTILIIRLQGMEYGTIVKLYEKSD